MRAALVAAGRLVGAVGTSAGLVVGHVADDTGASGSTTGPGAIALTVVLLAVTTGAGLALLRSTRCRPGQGPSVPAPTPARSAPHASSIASRPVVPTPVALTKAWTRPSCRRRATWVPD